MQFFSGPSSRRYTPEMPLFEPIIMKMNGERNADRPADDGKPRASSRFRPRRRRIAQHADVRHSISMNVSGLSQSAVPGLEIFSNRVPVLMMSPGFNV